MHLFLIANLVTVWIKFFPLLDPSSPQSQAPEMFLFRPQRGRVRRQEAAQLGSTRQAGWTRPAWVERCFGCFSGAYMVHI